MGIWARISGLLPSLIGFGSRRTACVATLTKRQEPHVEPLPLSCKIVHSSLASRDSWRVPIPKRDSMATPPQKKGVGTRSRPIESLKASPKTGQGSSRASHSANIGRVLAVTLASALAPCAAVLKDSEEATSRFLRGIFRNRIANSSASLVRLKDRGAQRARHVGRGSLVASASARRPRN